MIIEFDTKYKKIIRCGCKPYFDYPDIDDVDNKISYAAYTIVGNHVLIMIRNLVFVNIAISIRSDYYNGDRIGYYNGNRLWRINKK